MANFQSAGGGGVPVSASIIGASNPSISNVALATANTEVAIVLPSNTRKYMLKLRDPNTMKLAFIVGNSGTTYLTVWPGCVYTESDISATGTTIYVQSPTASQVVELVVWT